MLWHLSLMSSLGKIVISINYILNVTKNVTVDLLFIRYVSGIITVTVQLLNILECSPDGNRHGHVA